MSNAANTADNTNTRVIGDIRVSTQAQADDGVSLDAQRTKLSAYAVALDLDLVEIIVDAGVSAKSRNRDGVQRALGMLDSGQADGLLITKLDRWTRSVKDLGELVESYFADRFALLSVNDSIDTRTAGGRLVLNVLASVSQWEREATAERTREALAHIAADGTLPEWNIGDDYEVLIGPNLPDDDASFKARGYVIPAWSSVQIDGWRTSQSSIAAR